MKKVKVLALFLSILVFILMFNLSGKFASNSKGKTVDVYVAAVDIPKNTRIEPNMIRQTRVFEETVTPELIVGEDAVGKISVQDIFKNDILISPKIAAEGSSILGLGNLIETGNRAITLNVQADSGLAGLVRPSNKVDVIAVDKDSEQSHYVLEDVKVLAVDNLYKESAENKEYVTITLSVTPKDALKVSLNTSLGETRVVLRNPNEQGKYGNGKIGLGDA